jgi:hypothetical protein
MSLDVATTFLDAIGPTGQLLVLLLVGVPVMLVSVYLTSRAAAASAQATEAAPRLSEEGGTDR